MDGSFWKRKDNGHDLGTKKYPRGERTKLKKIKDSDQNDFIPTTTKSTGGRAEREGESGIRRVGA